MTDQAETSTEAASAQSRNGSQPAAPSIEINSDDSDAVAYWKKYSRTNQMKAEKAAKRIAELEDAAKPDLERLTGRVTAAERERDDARSEALRTRVALRKQLPDELADRLRGDTDEELSADADRLLALIKSGRARGDVDQGTRGEASTALSMNDLIRQAAGRG